MELVRRNEARIVWNEWEDMPDPRHTRPTVMFGKKEKIRGFLRRLYLLQCLKWRGCVHCYKWTENYTKLPMQFYSSINCKMNNFTVKLTVKFVIYN